MYKKENDEAMREQLLTEIIHKYGFENCRTLQFANRCEWTPYTSAGQNYLIWLHKDLINLYEDL